MANDEFWINQFDQTGNSKMAWLEVSRGLFDAADSLLRSYRAADVWSLKTGDVVPAEASFLGPLQLLRGAGMECLLKAVAIAGGHVLAKDGRLENPRRGSNHDLCALADAIAFSLDEAERDVLRRLGLFIVAGRYPIHMQWRKGLVPSSFGGGD